MGHGVDRNQGADGSGSSTTPIEENILDAKGDLIVASADNTADNLTAGANETRLVADSAQTLGLKYVADTTNYAIGAKGDLLVGTAADTLAAKSAGTDGYALQAQSGTGDGLQYIPTAPFNIENGSLNWSVTGNVLTVKIVTWAGGDPSATDPVYIIFRNPDPANGTLTKRKLTAATSIAINDTATLGTANSTAFRLWCVAFDDGGTVRLALINCLSGTSIYPLGGWGIASSTLEDNGADSAHVFYSDTAAVTSKAYSTLGYATWESGLATAGTWSAAPTRVQLFGFGVPLPGHVIQTQRTDTGAVATGTTTIPQDDTIPQNTEGDEYMSQAITPMSAANQLAVEAAAYLTNSAAGSFALGIALFRDSTASALKAAMQGESQNLWKGFRLLHKTLAASTSATTFKVRGGSSVAGTTTFNGQASARLFGGALNSFLEVQEIMA